MPCGSPGVQASPLLSALPAVAVNSPLVPALRPGDSDMAVYTVDILAVGFFILEWTVYAVTLEHSAYGRDSLSARMHVYREKWIRRLLDRETRMVDTQIMASLQNGTAFFASTSLLAVGGGLALLRSTGEALGGWPPCRSTSGPRRRCGSSNASG